MRHLLHKIVTKKTERLRACLLLALLITAGGLALGGKETPPTPAAPAVSASSTPPWNSPVKNSAPRKYPNKTMGIWYRLHWCPVSAARAGSRAGGGGWAQMERLRALKRSTTSISVDTLVAWMRRIRVWLAPVSSVRLTIRQLGMTNTSPRTP